MKISGMNGRGIIYQCLYEDVADPIQLGVYKLKKNKMCKLFITTYIFSMKKKMFLKN